MDVSSETIQRLNTFIEKSNEYQICSSPRNIPRKNVGQGMRLWKPSKKLKSSSKLIKFMVRQSCSNDYFCDFNAFIAASLMDAQNENDDPSTSTSQQPFDLKILKRKISMKPSKRKPAEKKEMPKKEKPPRRPAAAVASKKKKYRNNKYKRNNNNNSRRKNNGVRKKISDQPYKSKNPVRVLDELHGERTTERDLAYLKLRKLNIKTARRKPVKSNFGIFCEASWFRRKLYHKIQDHPIVMEEAPEVILQQQSNLKNGKRKRRASNIQDRADQFVYANIPTPQDLPPLPSAEPLYLDFDMDYDEKISEEYERHVKTSHRQCSTKVDFHWKEYLNVKLAKIPRVEN